jgi:hypothetical protein
LFISFPGLRAILHSLKRPPAFHKLLVMMALMSDAIFAELGPTPVPLVGASGRLLVRMNIWTQKSLGNRASLNLIVRFPMRTALIALIMIKVAATSCAGLFLIVGCRIVDGYYAESTYRLHIRASPMPDIEILNAGHVVKQLRLPWVDKLPLDAAGYSIVELK